MPASAPFSFGVYVIGPTHIRAYKNGIPTQECVDHASQMHHNQIGILALATAGFRVGRLEARDVPGGTIVYSEDFNGAAGTLPAGWTQFREGSLDGAGNLYIIGDPISSGAYTTLPAGAAYFELQNVVFDDESHGPHWGMIAPYWNGDNYGEQSYRVLARETAPHDVDVVDCTPGSGLGGWAVGAVRVA